MANEIRTTYSSFFEIRNKMLQRLWSAGYFPVMNIIDKKNYKYDGETLKYIQELPPSGGSGYVSSTYTLNTQGTQGNFEDLDFLWADPHATLEQNGDFMAMESAGGMAKLGKSVPRAEEDVKFLMERAFCGDNTKIIATHATGTSSGTTITGVCGLAGGGVKLQESWIRVGQYIQISTSTTEDRVVTAIEEQDDGTCTLTVAALTNSYADVDIYEYGSSGTALQGILGLIDNANTLGSSYTINRAVDAGAPYKAYVKNKDATGLGPFRENPLYVLASGIAAVANRAARGRSINLLLMPKMVENAITNKLMSQRQFEPGQVYGWPGIKNILPGVDTISPPAWPFGYVVGLCTDYLDKPQLAPLQWETGWLRRTGYDTYEKLLITRIQLMYQNLRFGFKYTGFTEAEYQTSSF